MPSISSAYRGPLIIMGLGGGFSVVGAVPVAITISIGVKTSATVIGMGFVAFGFLLMLPGFFWCIMVKTHSFKVCWKCCRAKSKQNHSRHKNDRRQKWGRTGEDDDEELEEEETPALCYNQEGFHAGSPSTNRESFARERKWPPIYVDTPSLMITGSKTSSDDFQLHKVQSPEHTSTHSSKNGLNNDNNSPLEQQQLDDAETSQNSSQEIHKSGDNFDVEVSTASWPPSHPTIGPEVQPSPEHCQSSADFDETAQRISNAD